ncbi:hypothetical protein NTE_01366 [Candidatus Nitrososphaera evergladensis SR1]|uniref:Uncharacterized protein n=1 Tax=Candidatus Nitrososphaera evergladensis SR1 TaxID=1459636 RepID=A0A075MVV2_9ARCH|nr:hypothetical protein [Candidatus Nitrososphaera evergladensis]AIF83434.1 hypothetical protein NTE_01366 [Candidatus Nitrososphaera evergladensis SR1]
MEETVSNISSTTPDKSLSATPETRKRKFIRLGRFDSMDKDSPNVLEVKPQTRQIYATEYSQCTDVSYKDNGIWIDAILPLRSNGSANVSLINQWSRGLDSGRIKIGKTVKILTWLDKSRNDRMIRRFRLVY